jgi:hypothetical protein
MKTKLKKLLAGILSAVMLTSSFAVFAADDNTDTLYHPDTKLEITNNEVAEDTNDIIPAETSEPDTSESEEITAQDLNIWDIPAPLDFNDELVTPFAADNDNIASGKCGANLTWTLDSEGTLTISGTGNMNNYGINPNNITSAPWGQYADSLKKLLFSNEMTSIGECAFTGCSNLTGDLIIPNNIISIGKSAFLWCSGFNGSLIISNGITLINGSTFSGCSSLTGDLIIPDSVTSIGGSAFSNCRKLTGNLVIPDSVTSIGSWAFSDCSGFTGDLILPSNITSIDNRMFYNCSNLTGNLVIPDSVTSIGDSAFYRCSSFTGNLVIPDSVTSISSSAFGNCNNLTDMYIPQIEDSIGTGNFPNRVHWKYDLSQCTATINNYTCTGSAIIPTEDSITVTSPNGKTLYYGTDYIIESAKNNTDVGTATARIAPPEGGISILSQDVPFNIIGIDLSGSTVIFPDNITWDGAAVEPEPTVILDGKTLIKGVDYTITYSNNIFTASDFPTKDTVKTSAATITGIGNYIGSFTKDFEVGGFKLDPGRDSIDIRLDDIVSATIDGTFVYNGKEYTPTPRLVYHFVNPATNVSIDYEMVEGEDFEIVSYSNNVNAGKAVVTIEGIGAFENTRRITFNISPCKLSATTIADIPSFEYCKKDICPDVEIKVDDTVMIKDVDYELTYENNRNRGTAIVTITGKGNLTGVTTKTFEITPRDGSRFTYYIILP